MEVLKLLLGFGLIPGICYLVNILGKCYVAHLCSKKNISDAKAKFLSKMMSVDINIKLR